MNIVAHYTSNPEVEKLLEKIVEKRNKGLVNGNRKANKSKVVREGILFIAKKEKLK